MLLRRIWQEFTERPAGKVCIATCHQTLSVTPRRAVFHGCGRKFYSEFMWLAKLRRGLHRWLSSHR